ncbi:MAG: hypothetical protein ABR504_00500 [Paracoccaceae bacterium]
MFRTLIAALIAFSMTLAPAPATANGIDNEDIAKIVLGLIALGAIKGAVDNRSDDDEKAADVDLRPRFGSEPLDRGGFVPPQGPRGDTGRFGTGHDGLPRHCLDRVETRYGDHRLFSQRCLERDYAQARDLPRACAVRLVTDRGARRGFDPICLRDRGYTTRW